VSAALGFAVHLLGAHPAIQQSCAAELDGIFGRWRYTTPSICMYIYACGLNNAKVSHAHLLSPRYMMIQSLLLIRNNGKSENICLPS